MTLSVILDCMKAQYKRATIYFDPELHKALKIKSVQSESTISDLVNAAIRQSLMEDYEDLAAFEDRRDEPNLDFEGVLKKLKSIGKL